MRSHHGLDTVRVIKYFYTCSWNFLHKSISDIMQCQQLIRMNVIITGEKLQTLSPPEWVLQCVCLFMLLSNCSGLKIYSSETCICPHIHHFNHQEKRFVMRVLQPEIFVFIYDMLSYLPMLFWTNVKGDVHISGQNCPDTNWSKLVSHY